MRMSFMVKRWIFDTYYLDYEIETLCGKYANESLFDLYVKKVNRLITEAVGTEGQGGIAFNPNDSMKCFFWGLIKAGSDVETYKKIKSKIQNECVMSGLGRRMGQTLDDISHVIVDNMVIARSTDILRYELSIAGFNLKEILKIVFRTFKSDIENLCLEYVISYVNSSTENAEEFLEVIGHNYFTYSDSTKKDRIFNMVAKLKINESSLVSFVLDASSHDLENWSPLLSPIASKMMRESHVAAHIKTSLYVKKSAFPIYYLKHDGDLDLIKTILEDWTSSIPSEVMREYKKACLKKLASIEEPPTSLLGKRKHGSESVEQEIEDQSDDCVNVVTFNGFL